ncbi:MAG: tRNA pseudouridine(55) synthase TruB [Treponema sp.]|jgi:tRNA pseudouridine55 synthase|nr:tRNA pseudouridine(55) synthase TruB [Treponema sp.]
MKKGEPAAPAGLLLLNKKPGVTSFEALRPIKKALDTGKVGHTGTLDKFAGGLLLVLCGRALKLSPWFFHCDKEYEGVVQFGEETDTLDPEGSIVAKAGIPSREAVERALPLFRGEIQQAPPAYSAIHIDGKRASALARAGKAPEMKKRPVRIYRLELLSWAPPNARIGVHCSSGTYIRSLARDIALAAGSRGRLAALLRTGIAGFRLDEAPDAGCGENGAAALLQSLRPIDRAVIRSLGLPWFDLKEESVKEIIQGKPLSQILARSPLNQPDQAGESAFSQWPGAHQNPARGKAAALFCGDVFAGIAETNAGAEEENNWRYGCVYASLEDRVYAHP